MILSWYASMFFFVTNWICLFILIYIMSPHVSWHILLFLAHHIYISQLQFFLYLISFYTVSLYLSLQCAGGDFRDAGDRRGRNRSGSSGGGGGGGGNARRNSRRTNNDSDDNDEVQAVDADGQAMDEDEDDEYNYYSDEDADDSHDLGGTSNNNARTNNATTQPPSLSTMFAQPTHLMHRAGGFMGAKNFAKDARRWLLVNIQSDDDFACHALNRDVCRDDLVESLVKPLQSVPRARARRRSSANVYTNS